MPRRRSDQQTPPIGNALVLGGGGTVGMAYHAGVLKALDDAGYRPAEADLVIGTSAGSAVGALVRSGLSLDDLWLASIGEHPTLEIEQPDESPWARAWETPTDLVRRSLGAAYVLQRSMVRVPMPRLPRSLGRLFPGGMYTVADIDQPDDAFGAALSGPWPDAPLWLVTVDIHTGRRVVLGRRRPERCDLRTAVMASCSIPAFFEPVKVGARTLVDGGVHSTTNADLACAARPEVVVAVVPMGYDPRRAPDAMRRLARRTAQTAITREAAALRAGGARMLIISPCRDDLRAMGPNMMRRSGNEAVTRIAYESTRELLDKPRSRDVLAQAAATPRAA